MLISHKCLVSSWIDSYLPYSILIVLAISEIRWPKSGKYQIIVHIVYYSGKNDVNRHMNRIGIILCKDIIKLVSGFIPISDRLFIMQLEAIPNKMNILAAYTPTAVWRKFFL